MIDSYHIGDEGRVVRALSFPVHPDRTVCFSLLYTLGFCILCKLRLFFFLPIRGLDNYCFVFLTVTTMGV